MIFIFRTESISDAACFRRRYFAVKRLDEGTNTLKKFQRQSKYEVGSAEWNPCDLNGHLCAISVRNTLSILCENMCIYVNI